MQSPTIEGRSILIVEDEPLLAINIEAAFEAAGSRPATTGTLNDALALVERGGWAAAIVDHSLGTETSSPLYDRLNAHRVPFIIHSAHEIPEAERKGGHIHRKARDARAARCSY